jgi:uncharacterized C2H2 Zn-finger protein
MSGKGDFPRPFSVTKEIFEIRYLMCLGKCPICNKTFQESKRWSSCSNSFHIMDIRLNKLENQFVKDILNDQSEIYF